MCTTLGYGRAICPHGAMVYGPGGSTAMCTASSFQAAPKDVPSWPMRIDFSGTTSSDISSNTSVAPLHERASVHATRAVRACRNPCMCAPSTILPYVACLCIDSCIGACVRASMHTPMHACVCECMCACMHGRVYACMRACTCVLACVYAWVCPCMRSRVRAWCMCACVRVRM